MRPLNGHWKLSLLVVAMAVVIATLTLGAATAEHRRGPSPAPAGANNFADPATNLPTLNAYTTACTDVSFDSSGKPVSAYECLPDGDGPWPAVVVLHGAEGPKLNGAGYRAIAAGLAGQGFAALFVDYFSLTPLGNAFDAAINPALYPVYFPTWLGEVRDAISYLQAQPAVDGERIALNGYSLGAYLALGYGTLDPRVKAVVEFYGGLAPAFKPDADRLPPVLILHGDADRLVSVNEAYALNDLLTSLGKQPELAIYQGAPHAFNFVFGPFDPDATADAYARTIDFLQRRLMR